MITKIDRLVKKYEDIFEKDPKNLNKEDRYPYADLILRNQFGKKDFNIENIYKNVVLLNSLYSTHVFATFEVARNIAKINDLEIRLNKGDLSVVEKIRINTIGGKKKNFYSFATKFCHHCEPAKYPIYDSFVVNRLFYYLQKDLEVKYHKTRMIDYEYFKTQLMILQKDGSFRILINTIN